ncbi:MAG: hypothetical protein DRO88_06550 [Promethearchaeia archaeon]|nr:MAG: hypothetical protein DRO88_06550 [Candidatus Lokiarchaeia archaeon]
MLARYNFKLAYKAAIAILIIISCTLCFQLSRVPNSADILHESSKNSIEKPSIMMHGEEINYLDQPIKITSDEEIRDYFSVNSVIGSKNNPLIISNLQLSADFLVNGNDSTSILYLENISIYLVIETCFFDVPDNLTISGFFLKNCPYVTINSLQIEGSEYGIKAKNCPAIIIQNSNIIEFSSAGISLDDCSNATLIYNSIRNGKGNGFEVFFSPNSQISHNLISNCSASRDFTGNGIFIQWSNWSNISHNQVSQNHANWKKNAGNGIMLEHSDYSILESNYVAENNGIHNNKSMGYFMPEFSYVESFIADTTGIGIYIQSTYYTVIRKNIAFNNSVNGFNFLFSDHGYFYNNTAFLSGAAGISVLVSYEASSGPGYNIDAKSNRTN